MIKLTRKISPEEKQYTRASRDKNIRTVHMTLDMRIRSRQRVVLDDGEEVGLFLERGSLIRGGDILSNDSKHFIKVLAAKENVSTVFAETPLALAKAAYHLGNRHVPLQIEDGWLRYQHDHVLDDLIVQMGLVVKVSEEAFEPEAGAYQQQGAHGHQHHSHHMHEHNHEHAH